MAPGFKSEKRPADVIGPTVIGKQHRHRKIEQFQTSSAAAARSALPPGTDIVSSEDYVRKVPNPEVGPHSITSSARASSGSGRVSPITFAALRLMTNSNLIG